MKRRKTDTKKKIYFMGSGAFAVPVLKAIAESEDFTLVGVASQIDKAAGRKRILTPTPLAAWADANGIQCRRVPSVNTPEYLDEVRNAAPDIIVVVSFGQLLRVDILNAAPLGCLNVHASILPKYRGASPIASAILNGDERTGVAFMRMERGLDSGPVYEVHLLDIASDATTERLESELAVLAAERICQCISRIAANTIQAYPQSENGVTLASKIRKIHGSIDWREDAVQLERRLRAYLKWPGLTFGIIRGDSIVNVKITSAKASSFDPETGMPGAIVACANRTMLVQCGKGTLAVERVLPEGKKDMSVSDFINGAHLAVGDVLLNVPYKLIIEKKA